MNRICLYGASGHGKVVAEIVQGINRTVQCFFDDNKLVEVVLGIPVLSREKIKNYIQNHDFIISIGNNKIRKRLSQELNVSYSSLIDPTAIISSSAKIGEGSVVMPGAIINSQAQIGKHCIINSGAIIEHDCIINDYSHISPGAVLTGNVVIREGVHVGANAVIIPNVTIGKWVDIGAGSVVLKDVPDNSVAVGNPSRIIKHNK